MINVGDAHLRQSWRIDQNQTSSCDVVINEAILTINTSTPQLYQNASCDCEKNKNCLADMRNVNNINMILSLGFQYKVSDHQYT